MKKIFFLLLVGGCLTACSKVSDPTPEPAVAPTTPAPPSSGYQLVLRVDTARQVSVK